MPPASVVWIAVVVEVVGSIVDVEELFGNEAVVGSSVEVDIGSIVVVDVEDVVVVVEVFVGVSVVVVDDVVEDEVVVVEDVVEEVVVDDVVLLLLVVKVVVEEVVVDDVVVVVVEGGGTSEMDFVLVSEFLIEIDFVPLLKLFVRDEIPNPKIVIFIANEGRDGFFPRVAQTNPALDVCNRSSTLQTDVPLLKIVRTHTAVNFLKQHAWES